MTKAPTIESAKMAEALRLDEPDPNKFLDVCSSVAADASGTKTSSGRYCGGFRLLEVTHLDERVSLLNSCPD